MTTPGEDNAESRLTFGRYVLDLRRGSLMLDGREVALHPKTFNVLRFLVEHPDRLVSTEELLAAVWPDLVVTGDALVQSIDELQRALGESGARLIATVPGRGYRFETTEAPPDRRKARGLHALRFRWKYGILAPLVLGLTVIALWLVPKFRDKTDSGAQASAKPAIAVLPFQNQGDDPAREHLADGITQDIIDSLATSSTFTVMSWNSVAPYKGAAARPGEIARVLAVRYQVQGSVRYSGDDMHVSAQIVDELGRVLWSARFDETPAGKAELPERIAHDIAAALEERVLEYEGR